MPSLDEVFDMIVSVAQEPENKAVAPALNRAAEIVAQAEQFLWLHSAAGMDIATLGIPDERKHGRRLSDRRANDPAHPLQQ